MMNHSIRQTRIRVWKRRRDYVLEHIVWPALFFGVVVGVFFAGPFFR